MSKCSKRGAEKLVAKPKQTFKSHEASVIRSVFLFPSISDRERFKDMFFLLCFIIVDFGGWCLWLFLCIWDHSWRKGTVLHTSIWSKGGMNIQNYVNPRLIHPWAIWPPGLPCHHCRRSLTIWELVTHYPLVSHIEVAPPWFYLDGFPMPMVGDFPARHVWGE